MVIMGPGPELDALVAEKVMGWRLVDDMYHYKLLLQESGTWRETSTKELRELHPNCVWKNCQRDFRPSTDISAAWEVVEKMAKDDFYIEIYRDSCGWAVLFGGYVPQASDKETAPHAICLAALEASGNPP